MWKLKKVGLVLAALAVGIAITAGSCGDGDGDKADQQRRAAVHQRAETFARAQDAVPAPRTENFPLRRALAEMTKRQDMLNHPWYVYVLGDNGNTIGYYVAKTVPINACDFLSSTEAITWDNDGGNVKTTAPSLDGIFYGGGGSSAGCDAWVFFDYSSDALIQIRDVKYFTADKPLNISAEPITVAGK